uniref:F-box associated beta-propeller type 3 domain-containing protein n=1 Tax=Brassica campestris TaxID=3711 RepID=A0A3P5ZIN6_BRACM|nr:unnamed protein product [Brassica rapa]
MELYLLKPGEFNFRHHATVDPPGRNAEHHMLMIASFNGLVCCINQLSDENEEDFQIWICNPSTEQTLLLPQGRPSFWTEPSIGVAYGPDMSEYKIFRIVSDGENGAGLHIECEVYSSSTGAWRIIGCASSSNVCFSYPTQIQSCLCRRKNLLACFFGRSWYNPLRGYGRD